MSRTNVLTDRDRRRPGGTQHADESAAYTLGVLNAIAGVLGLVGPLVWYNDDDGLVNTEPGLFLGLVAVSGPHAMIHVLNGVVGVRASRDRALARRYLALSGAFWGTFSAVGWRTFGFRRGIYTFDGIAFDRWGNLGHAILSVACVAALGRSRGS